MISWLKKIFCKQEDKTPAKEVEIPTIEIPKKEAPKMEVPSKKWDLLFADQSHHHEVDLSKYDKPVFINKTSQGLSMVDKTHLIRKAKCKEFGIKYVGYHFYVCDLDPILQAEKYFRVHGDFELNPILDLETWKSHQDEKDVKADIENAYKFMKHIQKLTGKTPIVYTYTYLLSYLNLDPKWSEFILWIADYRKEFPVRIAPFTTKNVLAWQFSDGNISHPAYNDSFGGCGRCDANLYFKENDFFKLMEK